MLSDSKTAAIRSLDRINLRLPAETFEAIDAARADRPGNISRNTWITEAVEEKLARDRAERGELTSGANDA
jgi:metal-responsive CopG/Arc/MetJ family transcriptional regulator